MRKLLLVLIISLIACGGTIRPAHNNGPRFVQQYSQDMDGYTLSVVCDTDKHVIIYHATSGSIAVNPGDTRSLPADIC